ncbi:MAG: ABC transporter ATP-binding protein [Spirochaetaceae bacterium]|nr:ABC transporter ATP-binding protein [Spirochaetaceae bacterium]
MPPVIEVEQLHKGYGEVVAVDDVSFSVDEGEIFGIIGPNGAGKTTTIECVIGLRTPDRGRISVLGMDPIRDRTALTERIGVQLQEAALADRIRVWEALDLFSSFYARTVPWQPLLQQWGLADHRSAMFGTLSGGQRQRLFIALALVNDPDVVILDELTSGLDPQARRATWDLVQAIREQGKTVLVITHFMDEAQFLCDRVAIVDHGSVIALDTPAQLVRTFDTESRVVFDVTADADWSALRALPQVAAVVQQGGRVSEANLTRRVSGANLTRRVTVSGNTDGLLSAVVAWLESNRVPFSNLSTQQADLEDVFLRLTGRAIRD